jgi:hypothetical protein
MSVPVSVWSHFFQRSFQIQSSGNVSLSNFVTMLAQYVQAPPPHHYPQFRLFYVSAVFQINDIII